MTKANGAEGFHGGAHDQSHRHQRGRLTSAAGVSGFECRFMRFRRVRIANELRKLGFSISPAGVRSVWQRHDLETMKKRLKALEAKVAQDGRCSYRKPAHGAGEGQERERGAWRIGERASRLLRRSGHLLCRHV